MKDHFGIEIQKGDLVVCMAIGRYSGMNTAIATNDKGGVRYERGGASGGTSNQVRIETEGNEKMTKLRLSILDKFIERDANAMLATKKEKAAKIKKSDQRLFGVYSTGSYDNEVRLGSITIGDTVYDNCWMKIYRDDYKNPFGITNYKAEPVHKRDGWRTRAGDVNWSTFRDCKYPKKTKWNFQLTEDEVVALLGPLAGGLNKA